MPPLTSVTKQKPTEYLPKGASSNGVPPSTGVLSQSIPVDRLQDDWVRMCIYGPNRVGKTKLASTFPKPLLLVSFEPNKTGGATTVKRVPGVQLLRVHDIRTALALADQLRNEEMKGRSCWRLGKGNEWVSHVDSEGRAINDGEYFNTLVVDTATSLQDVVLQDILGLEKLPEQLNFGGVSGDEYRVRAERTKEGLRPFLNMEMHTVVLAKEKDHNPPKEEKVNPKTGKLQPDMRAKFLRGMSIQSYVAPDLGGGTTSWILDVCDYICRLYLDKEVIIKKEKTKVLGKEQETEVAIETGNVVRRLRCLWHPNFAAGFRSCDPESVPEYIEEPTWEKIEKVIRGESL